MNEPSRTHRTRSAVTAASRRWQEAAIHIRGELRANGIRGELRALDSYARGYRGTAAAKVLHALVKEAHDGRLPARVIAAELAHLTAGIVADVYGQAISPAA